MDREHVRVATIGVIAVTLARRVRVEFQRARAVGRARQGQVRDQGLVFADVQGAVVRETSAAVASFALRDIAFCEDANSRREYQGGTELSTVNRLLQRARVGA